MQQTPAVLGAAFAASSQEDGGGIDGLPINEGEYGGTPWARQLGEIILPAHVLELHNPKESLLPVGYIDGLIQQVHIFHVHQIAGFTIVSCAFEPTTVAGLRIRTTVADILGVDRSLVLVQGYVSGYGHYAATPQEYDQQDYEGGATAFGRDTLPAITQTLANLTHQLKDGLPNRPGSASGDLVGFIPTSPAGAPNTDVAPDGAAFGDVLESPEGPVSSGEQIEVVFAAANPNHDLRHESGYHRIEDSAGARVADDAHEDSRIIFSKEGNETRARIIWDTTDMEAGEYSVRFSASSRDESGNLTPFDGVAMVTIGA
ncbi:neutral/alkaline non-lysosomal ceramidase N-terminal domain-containing protein [Corynebacterium sputi]|uniref:neutral/alkaline non-lysosomal ceramidase N-terminal domain-containing protein n=1 Tax=Corynebacterium sputi TaxID=489915 RepID=UPI0003FEAA51|nr:neutral/alkaline non-lysosomal ceramidase N-terminal domain-containing protein [Corynebacterium sputi]